MWGGALAAGDRPRCTKVVSQHFLTHGHSGTLRGTLTCWHTPTHTHTCIHTRINISLQSWPHTQECTHAQVGAHRSTCGPAVLTHLACPSQPLPNTTQSWPPAHILPPAQTLQGVKASFTSNALIHPSPAVLLLTSAQPSPHHQAILSLSPKLLLLGAELQGPSCLPPMK